MIGRIKDIVKENPGTAAVAGVVALGMFLSFGVDENLEDNYEEPIQKEKPKREFTQLKNLDDDYADEYDPYEEIDAAERKPASESSSSKSAGGAGGSGDNYNPYSAIDAASSGSYTDTGSGDEDSGGSAEAGDLADFSDSESPEVSSYCMKYPYAEQCQGTGGGGGNGGTEYFPTQVVNSQCGTLSVLPGDGAYVTNPYVAIAANDVAEIYYCFDKGGGCDPLGADGIRYNGNFQLSSTPGFQDNGTFTLSFYAKCPDGESVTSVVTANYVVDDQNVPLSYYQTPIVQQVQTQETHQSLTTTSTAFGLGGYSHFTYNVGGFDPSAENCTDLSENLGFDLPSNAMRTIASDDVTDTTLLTPTDYISVPLNAQSNPLMTYGDNYLVTFMQFVGAAGGTKYGCLSNLVVLKDFTYMGMMITGDYQTAPVGGIHQFQGQIQNFGHFGGSAPSGPGVGRLGNNQIETDLINIIN